MKNMDDFKRSVYEKAEKQNRIRAEKIRSVRRYAYIAAMLCIVLLSAFAVKQAAIFRSESVSPVPSSQSEEVQSITTTTINTSFFTTTAASTFVTSASTPQFTVTSTPGGHDTPDKRENEYIIEIEGEVETDYAFSLNSIDEYVSWAIIESGLELPDLNSVLDISKNWGSEALFRDNIGNIIVCVVKNTENKSADALNTEYISEGDTAIIYYNTDGESSPVDEAPAGFIIVKEYPYDHVTVMSSNTNQNNGGTK